MVALQTHDWIANPVHLIVMEQALYVDSAAGQKEQKRRFDFLESKCMVHIGDAYQGNSAWVNPNYPEPACQ